MSLLLLFFPCCLARPVGGTGAGLLLEGTGEALAVGEATLVGDGIDGPVLLVEEQLLGVVDAQLAEPLTEHALLRCRKPTADVGHRQLQALGDILYRQLMVQETLVGLPRAHARLDDFECRSRRLSISRHGDGAHRLAGDGFGLTGDEGIAADTEEGERDAEVGHRQEYDIDEDDEPPGAEEEDYGQDERHEADEPRAHGNPAEHLMR